MNVEEMNEGVQLLLKRMESNPQEFMRDDMGVRMKWGWIVSALVRDEDGVKEALPYLNDEEIAALKTKYTQVQRELFTARVLNNLAGSDEAKQEYVELQGKVFQPGPGSWPNRGTVSMASMQIGTQTLDEAWGEKIKAFCDREEAHAQTEKIKAEYEKQKLAGMINRGMK